MDKSEYFKTAAEILRELGITSPDEIDVEAIAFHCGATIRYRSLTGCAARIVGNGNRAIITVDSNSIRPRQRFSAAHEMGHWMHDRGKASFSCQESQFVRDWSATSNPESRANRYASDLLLPLPLFKPRAGEYRTMDFDTVRELAGMFNTSLTATAIRLAEHGPLPTMLVCYSNGERQWFVRESGLPEQLWPNKTLERYTYAYDLSKQTNEREMRGEVPAKAWFDHDAADGHYIKEHSIRTPNGDVLSLLWWKDERMLIDLEEYIEKRAARRSDWRED
jgi:Zn-dependent peptidase ImmA (M78 family)